MLKRVALVLLLLAGTVVPAWAAIGTPVNGLSSSVLSNATDGSGNYTISSLATKPTSTGDVMVLHIFATKNATFTVTSDSVSWTKQSNYADSADGVGEAVFTKQATAGDISGTPIAIGTGTTGCTIQYSVTVIPGATFDSASTGVVNTPTSGTSFNMNGTALAPTTNGDLFLATVATSFATTSAITFSTPTNYTSLASKADSTTDGSLYVFYRQKSSDSTSEQPSSKGTYTGSLNAGFLSSVLAFKASSASVGPIGVTGFGTYSSSSTSLSVTDPNNTGTLTATSGNTGIATVSPSSGSGAGPISFTVTGVSTGTTTITFADTFSNTHVVTVQFTPSGLVIRPYRDGPFPRIPGLKRVLGGWGS